MSFFMTYSQYFTVTPLFYVLEYVIIINIFVTFYHIHKTIGHYHLSILKYSTNTVPFSLELAVCLPVCLLDHPEHDFWVCVFYPTQHLAQCPTRSRH